MVTRVIGEETGLGEEGPVPEQGTATAAMIKVAVERRGHGMNSGTS
jgi:hypothetical protein